MIRLSGAGGQATAFQWSTDEQVWPFELANDGSTLYCIEFRDQGAMPNTGNKYIAHSLGDTTNFLLYNASIAAKFGTYIYYIPNSDTSIGIVGSNLGIYAARNWSKYLIHSIRLIYSKDELGS